MSKKKVLICPSCGKEAKTTSTRYGRRDDCYDCGLHSWDGKPLVDQETLDARQAAHDAFDKLWSGGAMSRSQAYRLLASELRLSKKECHMAQMDKETARRVPPAVEAIERRRAQGRCTKCENCLKLEKVKASVLKAVNPPFSHADQGVVDLWNAELKRLPCLDPPAVG